MRVNDKSKQGWIEVHTDWGKVHIVEQNGVLIMRCYPAGNGEVSTKEGLLEGETAIMYRHGRGQGRMEGTGND